MSLKTAPEMSKAGDTKYVCIHGHFYQPPRENPWLEEIEAEDSAAPRHDWNERINSECYRPNAAARFVDHDNRILSLRNNYLSMSFNFGPTLLRWIEAHDPLTYRAILESDRESCERLHGHGNAMAQAYNHIILPLANLRDKLTQVHWGIRDFERRFGRRPEGMWLAETAVDRETLEVLAEAGIRFTVLSPFQAERWRFKDTAGTWVEVKGGSIPTGRPYHYRCRSGKVVVIYFYDAALAKGIAFERLLEHSSRLVNRINSSFAARPTAPGEPWLIHTATDGESYGHHFMFGDMALAAAFRELERDPSLRLLNYGTFLDAFPVRAEVEIKENSAWSCAHGVGRWQDDCGCSIGSPPGWNQKWRAPLREAMNDLRDRLAEHFERTMGKMVKDPWKVRNDYIEVLLDPARRSAEYVRSHTGTVPTDTEVARFYQLLEMQRCAMYMFTSCGWFFDEISNLESVLIMRFAARAMQLAEQTGAPSPEPAFLKILEKAPSNYPEYGNGAKVYMKKVKPEVVTRERVAANYALQSLARSSERQHHIHCFQIAPHQEENLGGGPVPCLYGNVSVKDERTLEEESFLYAVLHFGGLDFRCSVKPYTNPAEYRSILEALEQSVEEQNTLSMIRVLDGSFGPSVFSLHNTFKDLRSSIALDVSRKAMGIYSEFQKHLYQTYRPLMVSLRQWGTAMPQDLQSAVRRVLRDELTQMVKDILDHEREHSDRPHSWGETDFFYRAHLGRVHSILEDARSWNIELRLAEAVNGLGSALLGCLSELQHKSTPRTAGKLHRLLGLCRDLGVKPELWTLQTLWFHLAAEAAANPKSMMDRIPSFKEIVPQLDDFLECRFARILDMQEPETREQKDDD